MVHANAMLAFAGRLLLAECIVVDGWPLRRAAERFLVSFPTAQRWPARCRERYESLPALAAMRDAFSPPESSPRQTRPPRVRKILHLRTKRGRGPARIAHKLGMYPSRVHRVLRREGTALLSEVDLTTRKGLRGQIKRYEHDAPGDLIHVDVKKLGKIPDGGGHHIHGRQQGRANSRLMGTVNKTLTGARDYGYVHTALDDHSRLANSRLRYRVRALVALQREQPDPQAILVGVMHLRPAAPGRPDPGSSGPPRKTPPCSPRPAGLYVVTYTRGVMFSGPWEGLTTAAWMDVKADIVMELATSGQRVAFITQAFSLSCRRLNPPPVKSR